MASQRPSALLGLEADDPLAFDVDRATLRFAQWFERKRKATVRRKPARDDGKVEVPKYGPEQLEAFLGIVRPTVETPGRRPTGAVGTGRPALAAVTDDAVDDEMADWFAALDDADPVA